MRKMVFCAVTLFVSMTSVFASPAEDYLQSGKAKIAKNDIAGCTADYKKAVEADPENSTALMAYATVLTTQQYLPQAQVYLDKYISRAGENDSAHFLQGAIYYYSKDYAAAIKSFNKISMDTMIKAFAKPGVRQYFLLRGESLLKLERYPEAINDFNHVLEVDPNNASALRMRGFALEKI